MGIKHLWSLLTPYSERKPLYELENKIIAVDLAGWVCENLNVVDYTVHPRLYLRNLFFRIKYLLQIGVLPVFVLEGAAPTLKYNVIAKRNELQFCGAKPRETSEKPQQHDKANKGRTRFNHVLKQCEEMIGAMGLDCLTGPGEAEAYCAYLNKEGFVEGVLSQDSDCFAYGAKKVYRNFSISKQGNVASQDGSVLVYDLDVMGKFKDFGRNKMIVMALLLGCDYCAGVEGVGKDSVLKLLSIYKEDVILERIKSWRENHDHYTEIEMKVYNKNVCSSCGHLGKVQRHTNSGCSLCHTHRGCDSTLWKDKRLELKAELMIRTKALVDPNFPSEHIINEFLKDPPSIQNLVLKWNQPKLVRFVKCMSKLLQWNEIYCFEHFFPLLTRWQLLQGITTDFLKPEFIKKKRTPKGVASLEIVWDKDSKIFQGLIPNDQKDKYLTENANDLHSLYSTVEPTHLFEIVYPELLQQFIDSKIKKTTKSNKQTKRHLEDTPSKPRKRKKNKKSANESFDDRILQYLENIDPTSSIKKRKPPTKSLKCKALNLSGRKQKTLSGFIKRKTKLNLQHLSQIEINDSELDDEVDLNLTGIINNMINTPQKTVRIDDKFLYFKGEKFSITNKENQLFQELTNNVEDDIEFINESLEKLMINDTSDRNLSDFPTTSSPLCENIPKLNIARKSKMNLEMQIFEKSLKKKLNNTNEYFDVSLLKQSPDLDETTEYSLFKINDDSFDLNDYVPLTKGLGKKLKP